MAPGGGGAVADLVEWLPAKPKVKFVVGQAQNKAGERTCFSGFEKGNCGEIVAVGVSVKGVNNLNETSVDAVQGDSGAREFTTNKQGAFKQGALIQGVLVTGEAGLSQEGRGKLTLNSKLIIGIPEGKELCNHIAEMKKHWQATGVAIAAEGVTAKTTVKRCEEVGATATVEMSSAATESREGQVQFGHKHLAAYEPMNQIETKFPGQKPLIEK